MSCTLDKIVTGEVGENVCFSLQTLKTLHLKLMTYKERLPAKKELDPLITWSCEITRQIKTIILIDKIKKLNPRQRNVYEHQT